MRRVSTPLSKRVIKSLNTGEEVLLNGVIYTARDRAHKKLAELIKRNKKLPLDLSGQIIYYCGPIIRGDILGSCGPTTSSRMDKFLEYLLKEGLAGSIGKGGRSLFVKQVIRKYGGIYFLTHAGCGAYLRKRVESFRLVAFPELGAEAIYEFKVREFPLIVGIDSYGKDIYRDI